MVEFYKNLWEKKLGKLEALRQAQLTMLREYDPTTGKLRGPGTITPVDPDKLTDSVKAAVASVSEELDVTLTLTNIQAFRPGRPTPTHRITN